MSYSGRTREVEQIAVGDFYSLLNAISQFAKTGAEDEAYARGGGPFGGDYGGSFARLMAKTFHDV